MFSHRRKLLPLCIAASLATGFSAHAAAIGVGEIHLQSFLGAPLQAEVPLNHMGDLSADQFKVSIGSQDDYSTMGVEYNYLHSQLKIEPIIRNGQGYVRISTREPITEPYLNFVLNLHWPQGQLVREFTVLLDPAPVARPVADNTIPVSAEAAIAATPQSQPAVAPEPRHQRRVHAAPAVREPAGEGKYLTQRGDSLWRIANRVRSAQVPVEQAMAVILALNPNAFINGNPNLLKEAATITVPSAEQIAATTAGDAPVPATAAAKTAAESIEHEQPIAAAAPVADKNAGAIDRQLMEENSALKTQVSDLTGNVATLGQNLTQSEQRLHQLETQLNELLQQMQQQKTTMAALSGVSEIQNGAPIAQSTGSMINQVNASELRSPPKAHTPWWVHLLYWLGIGGAVTWAVREHFWPQRRLIAAYAGDSMLDTTASFMPEPTPIAPRRDVNSAARNAETFNVNTRDDDLRELTLDLGDLPGPVAAPEHNEPAPQLLKTSDGVVDASITAGVFVAFGRFEEAERLLREAVAGDPSRIDLKLQLLDVLMQTDQPGAFDDLATEIESEAKTPEVLAELAVLRDSYRTRH